MNSLRNMAAEEKDREQRILAAKKKLKSFRAKQAQQQARSNRGSQQLTTANAKRISASIANAVESEIVKAAEESHSHARIPSGPIASIVGITLTGPGESEGGHNRTNSRTRHGRGHSRAGSISITADSMAATAAAARQQSLHAAHPPSSSHRRSSSSLAFSRPSSLVAPKPAVATATGRPHSRAHSRSGSRASIRPHSIIASAGQSTLLSAEYGPDSFRASGKPADWADVDENRLRSLSGTHSINRSSTTAAITQMMPVDNIPTSESLFSFACRDSAPPSPGKQARRQSRHARTPSLATKRESIELMGGLGIAPAALRESVFGNNRVSRQFNTQNRQSGIQPASVLFGGSADSRRSGENDFDWRGAFQYSEKDATAHSDDRRTALEKLEGRIVDTLPPSVFGRPLSGQQTASPNLRHRSQTQPRPSSVQLPSFEDIHGSEGLDKPSSTHLLEANERTTLEERGPSSPMPTWLAPPFVPGGLTAPELSASKSPKLHPPSLYSNADVPQPEGLGTLVEEEEEDESSSSPIDTTTPLNLFDAGRSAVEDEEAQKRRKDIEEETMKRTRRSSLQPRPLKLKSRPASLFVSSSIQQKIGLSTSPSLGGMSELTESAQNTTDEHYDQGVTPTAVADSLFVTVDAQPGHLAKGWSMSAAQGRNAAPTTIKPGMRALRLGSQSPIVVSPNLDTPLSGASESVSFLARKRASLLYNHSTSGSNSSYEDNMSSPPTPLSNKSRRRSTMIYKSKTSDELVPHAASSAPALASPAESKILSAELEELRAKSVKDAEAVAALHSQIEALTSRLVTESERASLEYSRLETWSAEKQQKLTERVDTLKAEVTQKATTLAHRADDLVEAERKSQQIQNEAQGRIEDLEAERDMLQEDVDGWRARCGDLEKSLKTERAALEGEYASNAALKVRLQSLTNKLKEAGFEAPADSLSTEEQLGLSADLMTALKTPASFDAGNTSSGSYFSPRIATSDPPPQAVKLLKDMRQQIFNLAGSLEHERKQHVEAHKLADELKEENAKLKAAVKQASLAIDNPVPSSNDVLEERAVTADPSSLHDTSMSSFSLERRLTAADGKTKRHVFAYDSSMGSVDQSNSSMGSGVTSMTSATGSFTPEEKDADECENLSNKILPLGVLQPLLEEDELVIPVKGEDTQSTSDEASSNDTAECVSPHDLSVSNFDLEAGGEPGEWDDVNEEDEAKAGVPTEHESSPRYPSDGDPKLSQRPTSHETFQTPATESPATCADLDEPKMQPLTIQGKASPLQGLSGPTDSPSQRSDVAPALSENRSEPLTHQISKTETINSTHDDDNDVDDDSGEDEYDEAEATHLDANRPEFMRDWSYLEALNAVKTRKSGIGHVHDAHTIKADYQALTGPRRRKLRQSSIDDFFGLLICEQLEPLPPLPTAYASLDMPPVYVEHYYEESEVPPYGEATQMTMSGISSGPHTSSRGSTSSSGSLSGAIVARQASIFGFGSAARARPPVARSAYVRDSISSLESGLTHGTSKSSSTTSGGGSSMAMGSTTIARMSLQSLTSAFSGLGGYLAGQSGAAVNAAAAATTMCTKGDLTSDSRNVSVSWTVQPSSDRMGVYGEDGDATMPGGLPCPSVLKPVGGMGGGAKRYSSSPMSSTSAKGGVENGQGAPEQKHCSQTIGSAQRRAVANAAPRRFISRSGATKPFASPVWTLDFVRSTETAGCADIFSI